MSTEDRVQSLRITITLLLVYAICLASALVSCHQERLAASPICNRQLTTGNWKLP